MFAIIVSYRLISALKATQWKMHSFLWIIPLSSSWSLCFFFSLGDVLLWCPRPPYICFLCVFNTLFLLLDQLQNLYVSVGEVLLWCPHPPSSRTLPVILIEPWLALIKTIILYLSPRYRCWIRDTTANLAQNYNLTTLSVQGGGKNGLKTKEQT